MIPKVYALYLPQFHEMQENNEWWGEGYTDWRAVRNAKPLYQGHYQPRTPQNSIYYDLSDPSAIRWQADLARNYGLSGFCIYHYYSNGQIMMQKPAEILLNNKDINLSYFFSWGNHDFRKNWFGGDKSLLRKQEYGGKADFQKHYEYLRPFFKDNRYLKIDNCPVFVIYQIDGIVGYEEMINEWNSFLKDDGFNGLYVVAMKCNPGIKSKELLNFKSVKAVMPFEPLNIRSNSSSSSVAYIYKRRLKTVLHRLRNKIVITKKTPETYSYKWAIRTIMKEKDDCKKFYCAFPDWDNTPRYQSNGVCFKGSSPERFYELFVYLLKRSIKEESEILFINAWNEWGESAYLEPDEKYGDSYLAAVRDAIEEVK